MIMFYADKSGDDTYGTYGRGGGNDGNGRLSDAIIKPSRL